MSSPAAARTYADRFQIENESGAGGMGTIFRARDLHTGDTVALKVLHERQAGSAERFNQEASLLAELAHPAIVRYVDHGVTPQGEHYLAMEWLEGETLEDRVGRGPTAMLEAARMTRRVLEALAVAHRKGIVHRDIKPSNLFLPDRELTQVKVLDFGIARRLFDTRRLTTTGSAVGTPMYMAPEQARGSTNVDARADIFSLGCVLWECIAGEPPFVGDNPMAVLAKICLDDSLNIREKCADVPVPLAALIGRMLIKDVDRRPGGAGELAVELGILVDQLTMLGFDQPGMMGLRRTPAPTITSGELRVLSAIMIAPPLFATLSDEGDSMRTWDVRATAAMKAGGAGIDDASIAEIEKEVEPLGARVDKLVGGAMVVTFVGKGTPSDQAIHAARCVLRLRAIVPRAIFAVSTGRAVMGSDLPITKVIDDAARLLVGDAPGAIAIDGVTASLLEARFEVGGEAKKYLLFEKGAKEAPRTLLGKEVPCVGRDRELANLDAIWGECVDEPAARAVLVTAGPGGGKSRVRHELLDRIQNRGEPFEYLVGRGDSLRAGSPFALIGPALRTAAGITGAETPAIQQKRLLLHVTRHLAPDVGKRTAAFLGEIAGVPFPDDDVPALKAARQDPRLMADHTLAAWLDWMEAECAVHPVLIVLEDLHWGDVPSVQFVDAALRNLRDRPFMVLAFGRPEVDEKFPSLWFERDLQRVALKPLGAKACQKLIEHVIGALPPDRLALIVERADGNPFYLEELMRAVAAGVDLMKEGALPDTVLGMVHARFDALGADAKKILRAASIFGQSFRAGAVKALLGEDTRDADQWLDILTQREVLFPKPGADAREFGFRHAMLRDAAYGLLTDGDKISGHKVAGEFLESAGEREAIVLVEHFERGHELPRAAYWSRFAASQALEANDLVAALERIERGVRCGAEGETLSLMRLTEAQARFWRGEYTDAERAAQEALLHTVGPARLQATSELMAALGQQAKFAEVEALVQSVRASVINDETRNAYLACLSRAVGYLIPSGKLQFATELLEEVQRFASTHDDDLRARVLSHRAWCALMAGNQATALPAWQEALRRFEAAGNVRAASEIGGNLGMVLGDLGVLDDAEQRLVSAVAAGERMNMEFITACASLNLAVVRAYLGRLPDARLSAKRALALAKKQGDRRIEAAACLYLALVEHLAQDNRSSEAHARAAMECAKTLPPVLPTALAALARALLAQGRAAEALQVARDAHDRLEAQGGVEDSEALIRLVVAECYLAVGDEAGARASLRRAKERLEERAAAIANPDWRTTFLKRLPDHARTLELAARLAA